MGTVINLHSPTARHELPRLEALYDASPPRSAPEPEAAPIGPRTLLAVAETAAATAVTETLTLTLALADWPLTRLVNRVAGRP